MQCQGYFLQITLGTRVVKQLNRNKFIFSVKQLKMNKFIFDARQLKMNKFIKSFLQFIISTSSIHLRYPPYTPESFEQDLKSYSSYIVLFSNYQILIFMWSLFIWEIIITSRKRVLGGSVYFSATKNYFLRPYRSSIEHLWWLVLTIT